jgi:RNA polymerase sigma-54 factor
MSGRARSKWATAVAADRDQAVGADRTGSRARLAPAPQARLWPTPAFRQALEMLQLPALELAARIREEATANPLLEVAEPDEDAAGPSWRSGAGGAAGEAAGEGTMPLDAVGDERTPRALWSHPEPAASDAAGSSLSADLHAQIAVLGLEPSAERALRFLADSLDENGYLTIDLTEASRHTGVGLGEMTRLLGLLQALDPPGVGCRSLAECLLLQWRRRGDGDPLVPILIERHLDDLARGRVERVAIRLGVPPAAVQAAADKIRRLEPKPGRGYGTGAAAVPVPDVVVRSVSGRLLVLVNDAAIPRLALSPAYRTLLARGDLDARARRFLLAQLRRARFVLRCLERRRLTLQRVVEAIVELQRPYLEGASAHLRPLTLREVAERAGVHESTVCRAASGKYVQTPRGVLPLKVFFSRSVPGAAGRRSVRTVRHLIRTLVASEDAGQPLSDAAIARALAQAGVRLSRRAVAGHRSAAGVPASHLRRRYR